MKNGLAYWLLVLVLVALPILTTGQSHSRYAPPKTPWGHPDLQGLYTNKDEANTPLERPDEFKGRDPATFSRAELADLVKKRQAQAASIAGGIGGAETGAGPTHWYEHLLEQGQPAVVHRGPARREAPGDDPASAAPRGRRRRAQRCPQRRRARRLVARSQLVRPLHHARPARIDDAGDLRQRLRDRADAGRVAIRYEMIHETRVIPLDGRPHVAPAIRTYLGDARGRWEGDTLVIETTNFTNRTHFGYNNRYNSEAFRLVERFTPVAPDRLQWDVTFNDPEVWTRPWTFTMPLTRDDSQPIFEYACHEGNLGLEHILSAARAEEAAGR